jgi:plastocyanin
MTALDSRVISRINCFAHRFSAPGTFRYGLSLLPVPASHHDDAAQAHTVTVDGGAGGAGQRTHYITVTSGPNGPSASPAHLEISAGDIVAWSADKSVLFGFRVRGTIGDDVLDSAAMRTESIFTHAFGLAGSYEWADANGSELSGRVSVMMPDANSSHDARLEQLQKGALVHVTGTQAEPAHIEIMVGQTVVWAVEKAPGVTITDRTLLQ